MQMNEVRRPINVDEHKEKAEAALARLMSLKCQVSELRAHCEALKKRQSEKQGASVCNECGKLIKRGEEVNFVDSLGEVKRRYHKDCFKKIWLSQTWKFDYSSPGFLRISKREG
jgi:hypothetical protein